MEILDHNFLGKGKYLRTGETTQQGAGSISVRSRGVQQKWHLVMRGKRLIRRKN